MSEWTTPAALREQLRRRWDKGELLAELAQSGDMFPLRLALRGPSSSELSGRFDAVRAWAAELQKASGFRLVMREVRHRVIGQNSLPAEAWVDTLDDALRLIGKTGEARAFRTLLGLTPPTLRRWAAAQPLRALALTEAWPLLLAFVAWLQAHARPGIYLRQVDLPGIHSKFVETHRGVLAELLDLALPAEAINTAASGVTQFAQRYGFLDKPLRVRFRLLDSPSGDGDTTLTQARFALLNPPVRRVFITENEINFLAFPALADSLVIFGAGYGFEALAQADWLSRCALHYWGDIDTHGFAILDQLRARHPHAQSFLMDRPTFLAHRAQWAVEPQPTARDLPRLMTDEAALYDDLRCLRLSDQALRLEQERIGFGWVARAVSAVESER